MKNKECCKKKASIGGQALIEGIMMRGPKRTAMAVRNPEGEIVLEEWKTDLASAPAFFKLPVARGVYNFVSSMIVGYKCLMRSAEIAGIEEAEEEAKREKQKKKQAKLAKKKGLDIPPTPEAEEKSPVTEEAQEKKEKKESSALMTGVMVVATILGVALSIFLFIMLPTALFDLLSRFLPFLTPDHPALASLVKSIFEGLLKILILVCYMALVTLMKDIRRTFQYHGAEHKTIFCYEKGLDLTVENVRLQRRFHPRCGTSFLILMLLVSIFISFFIDPLFILLTGGVPHTMIRVAVKLLLLPITMGIGYEMIRFAGKHDNIVTRIISAPGMWLQHVTVLEPTDDMIECALTAFCRVIPENDPPEEEAPSENSLEA